MNSLLRYFVMVFVAAIISVVFNKILKLRTIAISSRKITLPWRHIAIVLTAPNWNNKLMQWRQ